MQLLCIVFSKNHNCFSKNQYKPKENKKRNKMRKWYWEFNEFEEPYEKGKLSLVPNRVFSPNDDVFLNDKTTLNSTRPKNRLKR